MIEFLHTIPEWFELIILSLCIGAVACRLWVVTPSVPIEAPQQENLHAGMWPFFGIGIGAMIANSFAVLLVSATEMSGRPLSAVFPVLPVVIFHTHFGRVWLIRIGALILLSIMFLVRRRYRDSHIFFAIMLAILVAISMTESASGHASDKGDFSISEMMDLLHLLAASVWGGGILVLSISILPGLTRQDDLNASLIARIASRFSRVAGIAVGIIALTSLYNAWSYVGSFEALRAAPYGRTVIAKVFLFLLLMILGAYNRYISIPFLHRLSGMSRGYRGFVNSGANRLIERFLRIKNGYPADLRFERVVKVEACLMIGVLLCAALLRHEVPASHFTHLEHARVFTTGPEPVVSLETSPAKIIAGTMVAMTVHINDPDGRPLKGLAVSHERILHAIIIGQDLIAFAHIHPEDLGPITDAMLKKETFPLRFTFPKAGRYLIGLDFATTNNYYSESLSLSVAGKPIMGRPQTDFRTKKDFGDYRVTLTTSPKNVKAGEETTLRYSINKNEKAVTDLVPYLGVAMHLAIVSADLKQIIHAHGVVPGESHAHHDPMHANPPKKVGPEIETDIFFPVKGTYTIFSQVKHRDKVLLFDFMVKVQ